MREWEEERELEHHASFFRSYRRNNNQNLIYKEKKKQVLSVRKERVCVSVCVGVCMSCLFIQKLQEKLQNNTFCSIHVCYIGSSSSDSLPLPSSSPMSWQTPSASFSGRFPQPEHLHASVQAKLALLHEHLPEVHHLLHPHKTVSSSSRGAGCWSIQSIVISSSFTFQP